MLKHEELEEQEEEVDFIFSYQFPSDIVEELRQCDSSLRLLIDLEDGDFVIMARSVYENLCNAIHEVDGIYWQTYANKTDVVIIPHQAEDAETC